MNFKTLRDVQFLIFALLSIASAGTDIYFFAGDHCLTIYDLINVSYSFMNHPKISILASH